MDLERWFPMSIARPRAFFDDSYDDPFVAMNRQMQAMQRDMERMSANFRRISSSTALGTSPLDMRHAEDAMALNPVVTGEDGAKKMQMNFDVRAFKPEEITVKTKDGKFLEVQAKHEETSDHGAIMRQYHRKFTIPSGVEASEMSSVLSPEGMLTITAPIREPQAALEQQKERPIAITHE